MGILVARLRGSNSKLIAGLEVQAGILVAVVINTIPPLPSRKCVEIPLHTMTVVILYN